MCTFAYTYKSKAERTCYFITQMALVNIQNSPIWRSNKQIFTRKPKPNVEKHAYKYFFTEFIWFIKQKNL